jgi:hypothetical protein
MCNVVLLLPSPRSIDARRSILNFCSFAKTAMSSRSGTLTSIQPEPVSLLFRFKFIKISFHLVFAALFYSH